MVTNKKTARARAVLAKNILRLREERNVTQERLGELADLHPTYISAVENCRRNISIDAIEKLSKALKISIADLFVG